MAAAVALVKAYLLGRLVDQGLANFFGEATLRHGTHPLAWLSIHLFGPTPAMEGNFAGGRSKEVAPEHQGLFFCEQRLERVLFREWKPRRWATPRLIPRFYCFLSTRSLLAKFSIPSLLTDSAALITALIFPLIRIRMAEEDLERMHRGDPGIPATAVYTNQWIPPWNLGTLGTIWNALHYKTPLRMWREPMRVIMGIAQLTIAATVAYYVFTKMPDYIVRQKTALIAGAILGMI